MMYISSFHIDGFGIFLQCRRQRFTAGHGHFSLGANEAGKIHLPGIYTNHAFGYSNRKMAKRFGEPVNGGRPGGNLVLRVDGQGSLPDEIRLSRRLPEKSGGILSLHAPDGTPSIPTSFIASWLASRKMFTGPYMVSALPNFLKISPASMRGGRTKRPLTAPVLGQA